VNVGLFAPYDLARAGGVGTHIRAQARALRALGHKVRVCGPASAPLEDGETALGGCVSMTLGGTESGVGLDPRAVRRLSRLFAEERFDIVHVHEPLMPAVAWWAVWLARAPVVGTFHVHREQGHTLYRVARPLLAPLMRRIRARIAVSDAARETVAARFPGDYQVIPNGIEVARFQTRRQRPPALAESGSIVLYVGRLEPRKGVATLVEAMARVQRGHADARLVVIGDGPDRASLAELAARAGTRVLFAGAIDDDALPAFYQAADVVCAPALGGESFGIVLLEALASGKPVVASRIAGYAGVAGGTRAIHLTPPGDAIALADRLVALLESPAERAALADDAVRAAARFDWGVQAARIADVYERALAGAAH
jgi:phosphatidylinositol alpha-mannosyltransferase